MDWSTYHGGLIDEAGHDVDISPSGLVDVVGGTTSNLLSTAGVWQTLRGGDEDAFVTQYDPSGGLPSWFTYYGGSGFDQFRHLVHGSSDEIYAVGYTTSSNGNNVIASVGAENTALNGASDAMLVKFDDTGTSRLWGTYFGGNGNEIGEGICIAETGTVYIVGSTTSTADLADFVAHDNDLNSFQDGFVAKVTSTGDVLWAAYIGGSDGYSVALGCTVDSSNNVYVVGYTEASTGDVGIHQTTTEGTTYGGVGDAFIMKFNTNGTRQWGRYFGGTALDRAEAVDLDEAGNLIVTGHTLSSSGVANLHDTTLGGGHDAFVGAFLSSNGNRRWARYYGAAGVDELDDVQVVDDKIFLSGWTSSDSGVTTSNAFDGTFGGGLGTSDALFVVLDRANSGSTLYATYIGGDQGENGMGVSAEPDGLGEYNAVLSGYTRGSLTGIWVSPGADSFWNGGSMGNPFDAIVTYFSGL
ncbi:hypothetical protein [Nannocystis punicea]|uniref:Beta-propeller repeat-containing protein n=1 Tax=Nannocystis punicea TaxID=2995304 RepID=A0ABY7GZP1_9BACT|nr:hypothetical protein [Nannocystis poenicansa]WAS92299.1 hypothetical protein O0S08_39480 [Nannocystis poenicansa]